MNQKSPFYPLVPDEWTPSDLGIKHICKIDPRVIYRISCL